jgi:putative addiction module component (TIGR02574 family)
MSTDDVFSHAMSLPADERTRLAALLMDSVEASEDEGDVEAAWLDEITRRLDDHERGARATIPAERVFAEARARVQRARG